MRAGSPGFQPIRLQEARRARGLSQVALAQTLGRSSSTVSRWEKGRQSPEPETLRRLGAVLQVPSDFFFKPAPDFGGGPCFFRSMSAATLNARERIGQRLRWLQDIGYDLQSWLELPAVDIPDLQIQDYRTLSDEDIEAAAERCRRHWRLGQAPITDMLLVLENAGAVVAFDEFGAASIDGVSAWSKADDRPYVLLSRDKRTAVRSRFDAAHELGHLVLHRHIDPGLLRRPVAFKEVERQAHRFAGAFLMPAEGFCAELDGLNLDALLALKLRWQVSVAAMIYRCRELGILTEAYAARLWQYRSARRWTRAEPYDDQIPMEQPRLLARSFALLLEEGFSAEVLLAHLRLPAHDVETLAGLPAGLLSAQDGNVRRLPSFRRNPEQNRRPGKVVPFHRR